MTYLDEDYELNYRHTHVSKQDGSPAMLFSVEPFELVNEDGYVWQDDPDLWEEIPPYQDEITCRDMTG